MTNAVANKKTDSEVAKQDTKLSFSERFTQKVISEFNGNVAGGLQINEYQRRLIQNYFIAIDSALKTAEERRLKNKSPNKEQLPVVWSNVDMDTLAVDAVRIARLGLDSAQKNHINFMPFKNNSMGKYEVVFVKGYVGLEYIAKKYALDMPVDVVCELVYSTDTFKPIKRGPSNPFESYEFEITNPFDRGNVVGGFYYMVYEDKQKNRLTLFSLKDIMKRKPRFASTEFWGGEKDVWVNGKKTGAKETVEGWFEEMCLKTIKRAAYGSIPLDPQKVDDNYHELRQREQQMADLQLACEIAENANQEIIDIEGTMVEPPEPEAIPETAKAPEAQQATMAGPGF